ncbi:hypothetical protein PIB30_062352 [Stylosanthes scabra]|uniref:Uncharacterized protein n=1 Tax=Stylosanthes scabra TaxID=79078 RepID=A0ABU6YJY9_9FABA|nr:hypothetical protein [Stylosanthes scabra]
MCAFKCFKLQQAKFGAKVAKQSARNEKIAKSTLKAKSRAYSYAPKEPMRTHCHAFGVTSYLEPNHMRTHLRGLCFPRGLLPKKIRQITLRTLIPMSLLEQNSKIADLKATSSKSLIDKLRMFETNRQKLAKERENYGMQEVSSSNKEADLPRLGATQDKGKEGYLETTPKKKKWCQGWQRLTVAGS